MNSEFERIPILSHKYLALVRENYYAYDPLGKIVKVETPNLASGEYARNNGVLIAKDLDGKLVITEETPELIDYLRTSQFHERQNVDVPFSSGLVPIDKVLCIALARSLSMEDMIANRERMARAVYLDFEIFNHLDQLDSYLDSITDNGDERQLKVMLPNIIYFLLDQTPQALFDREIKTQLRFLRIVQKLRVYVQEKLELDILTDSIENVAQKDLRGLVLKLVTANLTADFLDKISSVQEYKEAIGVTKSTFTENWDFLLSSILLIDSVKLISENIKEEIARLASDPEKAGKLAAIVSLINDLSELISQKFNQEKTFSIEVYDELNDFLRDAEGKIVLP